MGEIYPYFVHFGAQITQFGPGPKMTDQHFFNDLSRRYNATSVKSLGTIGDVFSPPPSSRTIFTNRLFPKSDLIDASDPSDTDFKRLI